MITGRTYYEHGQPVTILAQWSRSPLAAGFAVDWLRPPRSAPRNVLVRRADGSRDVRPFRGLRKAESAVRAQLEESHAV